MSRIAILGGSFNPIHIGHLLMAQSVLDEGRAEQIVFMPSNLPPHKPHDRLASNTDRLEMVRLAIADNPAFTWSDQEIVRGGLSYAVDTLLAWHAHRPGEKPSFILGMDALLEIHAWHRVEALLPLCAFITLQRPWYDPIPAASALKLPPPWPERLLAGIIPGRSCDVSSSEIRKRIARNRQIRYLTPESVVRYIETRELYRTGA
jgi:nicotinate-nucleotide adenylyltransferase